MRLPIAIALFFIAAVPSTAAAALPCTATIDAADVTAKPGPPLRFGIGPLVQAGQAGGGPAVAVPEQPRRTHAALARLKPDGRPSCCA